MTLTSKFSILIPSWNNLPYLRICVNSIRNNSRYPHQVIVHVNQGEDGTLDWLKENKIEHTFSNANVGICTGVNTAFNKARATYIVYMNDDMYVCPDWDHYLLKEIGTIGHKLFLLSSTMIEHTHTGNPCVLSPFDFGKTPDQFNEKSLLTALPSIEFHDWQGSTWPPVLAHMDLWEKAGGFSEEFSPGLYSDPDFSMKMWQLGVRYFKGIEKSRVYHFQSKTLGRIKMNDGKKQFLKKWGISSSSFTGKILKRGEHFSGPLKDQAITPGIKDRISRLLIT